MDSLKDRGRLGGSGDGYERVSLQTAWRAVRSFQVESQYQNRIYILVVLICLGLGHEGPSHRRYFSIISQ